MGKVIGWILKEFDDYDLLHLPVILPTEQFFPDPFDGTQESVQQMLNRICKYMKLDSNRVQLALYSNEPEGFANVIPYWSGKRRGPAGLYISEADSSQVTLAIDRSQIGDPTSLVATIAHELGHVHLLGDGRLGRDNPNHEPATDILTILFGLGIFTANSAFQFKQWQDDSKHGWSTHRLGYLSEEMIAFSLALYSVLRGDTNPDWICHLAHNVKFYMKQSLRYIGQSSRKNMTKHNK